MNVVLRRWRDDDAEWYAEAVRDADIQQFSNEGDVTAEQIRAAMQRLAQREGVFAIADGDTDRPIGNIGWRRDRDPNVAEIYYWVEAPSRRNGVAARALELVSEAAMVAGATTLRLVIDVDNAPSRALADRARFELVSSGEPRDRDGMPIETVVYERGS